MFLVVIYSPFFFDLGAYKSMALQRVPKVTSHTALIYCRERVRCNWSYGLGLKTKFFGLGLEPCGLVNITVDRAHTIPIRL